MNINKEKKYFRLKAALYGLSSSPGRWFSHNNDDLSDLGFIQCSQDQCLHKSKDFSIQDNQVTGILIAKHVDDYMILGDDKSLKEFQVSMRLLTKHFMVVAVLSY